MSDSDHSPWLATGQRLGPYALHEEFGRVPSPKLRNSVLLAGLLLFACGDGKERPRRMPELPPGAEAWSLHGEPLYPPPLSEEKRAEREAQLAEARAIVPADSADRAIWIGRRLAYLGRFRDAIAAFGEGIARHPEDARLYRHRGHRYITTRRFDLATLDLERAAALIEGKPDSPEPDGQPNARGIPIGTLHSNVWYHLGLVYYLTEDYANAVRCYGECMKTADNPDRLCSTSYWLYLALRRMGRHREANEVLNPISADMEIVENHSYHQLLLAFRDKKTVDEVVEAAKKESDAVALPTVAYGLGVLLRLDGQAERAAALARDLRATGNWPAFGFIAMEADELRYGTATRGTPERR